MIKRHDILGNELRPGNLLAYAVAAGRGQVLNLYTILEITDRDILCKQVHRNDYRTKTDRVSRLQDPESRGLVTTILAFKDEDVRETAAKLTGAQ